MRVDLYTDAGLKSGIGTWATVAVAAHLGEPIEASGRLRADLRCTATAELRAIANALHRMIRRGDLVRGDEVRVLTDSKSAVERIMGRVNGRPESTMAKATVVIHALAKVHEIDVRAVWIPSHKPDDFSPHARWNNRCDALCRAARMLPAPTKARRALEAARRLEGGA